MSRCARSLVLVRAAEGDGRGFRTAEDCRLRPRPAPVSSGGDGDGLESALHEWLVLVRHVLGLPLWGVLIAAGILFFRAVNRGPGP